MAFWPPVSAMNGTMGPSFAAKARSMCFAVAVPPVKATPAMAGWATNAAPARGPPKASATASAGTPLSRISSTAVAAMVGVCGAGAATTALPAARAAVAWPVKMASGKFHGEMQANTPRPRRRRWLDSPVGPGRGVGAANSRSHSAP